MWYRLSIFLIFLSLSASILWAQETDSQDSKNKNKLWLFKVEGFADLRMARPYFDLPSEVYFTPAYRWPNEQVAAAVPPFFENSTGNFMLGVNVHPFPTRILNGFFVGYALNFYTAGNDFRGGPFFSRAQFANGENAFSYTRLSRFGHTSTLRTGYGMIPLWQEKNENGESNGVFLEIGPQFTVYNDIEITQGHDTWNHDVVYRQTIGRGRTYGGAMNVKLLKFYENGFRIGLRFGAEYEKGYLEFPNFPGRRPFSKISVGIFGVEIGF